MAEEQELIDIPEDELMLTTMDNPYNPKEEYEKWRIWDIENGYDTESLLGRLVNIPVDVDDPATIDMLTTEAMMVILEHKEFGDYKLV